jgi:hypothetical protein
VCLKILNGHLISYSFLNFFVHNAMYTTEFTSLRPKNTTSLSTVDPGSYTYISIVKIHVIDIEQLNFKKFEYTLFAPL